MPEETYDLIVIGGGSGGLVAASGAARLGLRCALIEKARLGGECLWTGCVPSKALIHSAKVAHFVEQAASFGLEAAPERVGFGKVMDHVREAIARVAPHDDPERFRQMGVEVVFGSPQFVSPEEVEVDGRRLRGRHFVIATGSRPEVPRIDGLTEVGPLTNENAFDLAELPGSVVILGAGPIGVEFSQAYNRLGVKVTVLQRSGRILSHEDGEAAAALEEILVAEGVEIIKNTSLRSVSRQDGQKVVSFEREGQERQLVADEVLVALGRHPNVEGLELERAGVKLDRRGIIVDKHLRTSAPHIWACGDVIGHLAFTHVAEYQARLILRNAFFPFKSRYDYSAVPWTTFSDPELAHLGATEEELREKGVNYEALRFPFSQVDRALTDSETAGFIKALCRPGGEILGAHILGPQAGNLIHEFALAMREGIKIGRLSTAVHAYPTLAQAVRQTADQHYARKLAGRSGAILSRLARLWSRVS